MNLTITLGKEPDSEKDIYINLSKQQIHTILIAGPTGSGKSTFHHSVTNQIIRNNAPDEVGFVFLDLKAVEFGKYKDSEYLYKPVVSGQKEAVAMLKELISESKQRSKGKRSSKKAVIIHIEECDLIYSAPDVFFEAWKTINDQSDSNNMYIFFSTSKPSLEVLSPVMIKYADLKGVFTPELNRSINAHMEDYISRLLGHLMKYPLKSWTRIFKTKTNNEIVCQPYI